MCLLVTKPLKRLKSKKVLSFLDESRTDGLLHSSSLGFLSVSFLWKLKSLGLIKKQAFLIPKAWPFWGFELVKLL